MWLTKVTSHTFWTANIWGYLLLIYLFWANYISLQYLKVCIVGYEIQSDKNTKHLISVFEQLNTLCSDRMKKLILQSSNFRSNSSAPRDIKYAAQNKMGLGGKHKESWLCWEGQWRLHKKACISQILDK